MIKKIVSHCINWLFEQAKELAEARERMMWHEAMSRRNIESSEVLQVKRLNDCHTQHLVSVQFSMKPLGLAWVAITVLMKTGAAPSL